MKQEKKEASTVSAEIQQAIEVITSGVVQCIPLQDLVKKLQSGKKLQIKLGMDPTAPDLHLGHAVVLKKLKQMGKLYFK